MGRGKVQMKRIEVKAARRATFGKRKSGLMKKGNELSVLCDADVGIVIFSDRGKLSEFCNGDSMAELLARHAESEEPNMKTEKHKGTDFLQEVSRHLRAEKIEMLNLQQLDQQARNLSSMLRQARIRKKQLFDEYTDGLCRQRDQLELENRQMTEIAGASHEQGIPSQQVLDLNIAAIDKTGKKAI